jgi:peptidoglycan/LPS O-acetylase OafA/YrhL
MQLIENFRYRPEIDGLRAVAVLAVVLFHAGLGVPGGFVGVDVFFVISGFLITSLILKDLQAGKFSLAHFWERRARRIIPAAVVMVVAVLIAGWFLLLPSDYAAAGRSAGMHAIFASNIHFWRSTNYFASSADEQPLLHTWSLAVEEQFYLIVPFLLLFLFRYALFRCRGPLLLLLIPAFMISLALSVFLLPRAPAATFYLLPTRAWELLAGSIVALLPAVSLSRLLREVLCGLALAAILAPCFLYTKETPFPGLAALPSCLGTCLLIWASSDSRPGAGAPLSAVGSLLSSRPFVFIGLISYSLYLWHWPLFAFSSYWALEPLSAGYRLCLVVAGFLLAVLSWRFVETPFRTRRLGASRHAVFGWAGGGLLASMALSVTLMRGGGFPERFTETVLAFDSSKDQGEVAEQVDLADVLEGRLPRLGAAAPAPVTLLVWGDSHAGSLLAAADRMALDHSESVLAAWHSGTPPVLDYAPAPDRKGWSLGNECPAFNQAILELALKHRIPDVLLVARWSGYFEDEFETRSGIETGTFGRQLVQTVKRIHAAGSRPWILMEVPNHGVPVPKALVVQEVFSTDISRFAATMGTMTQRNRPMLDLIPELESAGARIIDTSALLLDPATNRFRMAHQRKALYFDSHHLTRNGALFVREALAPVFDRSDPPTVLPRPITSGK